MVTKKILDAFDIMGRGVAIVFEAKGGDAGKPVESDHPTPGEQAVIHLDGVAHEVRISGVGNTVIRNMNEALIRGDLTKEDIKDAEMAVLEFGRLAELADAPD